MARLFLACMVLLGLTMATTAASTTATMARVAARPATTTADDPVDCIQDVEDVMNNCKDYVLFPDNPKIPPSAACCSVIKKANMPCLCSKVNPMVETLISMDKVVYVAKYCKRPLQPGSQCGSYHVPDALD